MALNQLTTDFYDFHHMLNTMLHTSAIEIGRKDPMVARLVHYASSVYGNELGARQVRDFNDLMKRLSLPHAMEFLKPDEFEVVISEYNQEHYFMRHHIHRLFEVFRTNKDPLNIDELKMFRRTFTSIYNFVFDPFFPEAPQIIYDEQEINHLLILRSIPWYIHTRVQDGEICFNILKTSLGVN